MATNGSTLVSANTIPIIVAAIVACILVVMVVSTQTTALSPFMLRRNVDVNVTGNNIYVSITISAPISPYYYYYGGYYYYYYGGYYGPAMPGIPVKVIVVLEKLVNGAPILLRATAPIELSVGSAPVTTHVEFKNVEPGTYRVKVMFWNELLINLHEKGDEWIPLAYPYYEEINISP